MSVDRVRPVSGGARSRLPIRTLVALPMLAGLCPSTLPGQQARVSTGVAPDTVRVGQPFVLGVSLQLPPGAEPRFPGTLPIVEDMEQIGVVEVNRQDAGEGLWRGYYRLRAWTARPTPLPGFVVDYVALEGEGRVAVRPGTVEVASVLPADTAGLELRPARAIIEGRAFPWLWVLLSLLVIALAYWSARRSSRTAVERMAVQLSPMETALVRLRALREEWEAGQVDDVLYFDRLESILRDFLEAVRAWPRGTVLRAAANGHRPLRAALRCSALVRFGRLQTSARTIASATQACAQWIRSEAGNSAGGGSVSRSSESRSPERLSSGGASTEGARGATAGDGGG